MSSGTFRCSECGQLNRVPFERLEQSPKCGRCKKILATTGTPAVVDDTQLERLIARSPVPVLVDFYADWCGPCRVLSPSLAKLAEQHRGKLLVVKVDTEVSQRKAQELGVQGIPAVFLFKGGQLVDNAVGARPLPFWQDWVAPHV